MVAARGRPKQTPFPRARRAGGANAPGSTVRIGAITVAGLNAAASGMRPTMAAAANAGRNLFVLAIMLFDLLLCVSYFVLHLLVP